MAMRKREDEVLPNAAGIDIGASSHWVAVPRQLAEAAGCDPVREVGAMTADLEALAAWLVSHGRAYGVAVANLPGGRGDGQPITTLIDLEAGTQPVHYFAGAADTTLLLAGSGGCGLLARAGDLRARQRASAAARRS